MIFSTSTGQGHNQAGRAVREYLDSRGVETIFSDVLDIGRKKKSARVSNLYEGIVNHVPFVFGALYAAGERITSDRRHSPIYFLNSLYSDFLGRAIEEMKPDVIVCPHLFGSQAVTKLIERKRLDIPTVGVMTDYCCIPFLEETRLDRYAATNALVAEECVARGMRPESLLPLGIPVSGKFSVHIPKAQARAAFGLKKETVFVITGGSMGYGKIPQLAAELVRRRPDADVVAVCGHNKDTYNIVKNIAGVTALPFINNLDVLLDAADVLLTKPGGLSTTEAAVKRLPLVITRPIPGVEDRNAAFFAKTGMAIAAKTVQGAVEAACRLAGDEAARRAMLQAQERHCSATAARDIGELVISMAR